MKLLALSLALLVSSAHALVPEDLDGGDVLGVGRCYHSHQPYGCALVLKDGSLYLILSDGTKDIALYSVKEEKPKYQPQEMTLVWSHDMT